LVESTLDGTPITQEAAEGALTDMLQDNNTTANMVLLDALNESEPEEQSDGEGNTITASQQVVRKAITMKKVESSYGGS